MGNNDKQDRTKTTITSNKTTTRKEKRRKKKKKKKKKKRRRRKKKKAPNKNKIQKFKVILKFCIRHIMKFSCLVAALAATCVAGQFPPSPGLVDDNGGIPSPSPGIQIPSPAILIPSPTVTIGIDQPAPAPGDLFNPSPDNILVGEPAPDSAPAPTVNPAPVISNPAPGEDDGNIGEVEVPAPEPALFFFCQTAVLCYDCDDKPITQQSYVATKWNDSYCDNGVSMPKILFVVPNMLL